MRNAFTIAELVIVACIIGILASLVVPIVQNRATEAKVAAARDNLRLLRGAVKLYAAQHGGVAPGYENNSFGSTFGAEFFRDQTTVQDSYMRKVPANPFNNLDTINLDWPGTDENGQRHFDY